MQEGAMAGVFPALHDAMDIDPPAVPPEPMDIDVNHEVGTDPVPQYLSDNQGHAQDHPMPWEGSRRPASPSMILCDQDEEHSSSTTATFSLMDPIADFDMAWDDFEADVSIGCNRQLDHRLEQVTESLNLLHLDECPDGDSEMRTAPPAPSILPIPFINATTTTEAPDADSNPQSNLECSHEFGFQPRADMDASPDSKDRLPERVRKLLTEKMAARKETRILRTSRITRRRKRQPSPDRPPFRFRFTTANFEPDDRIGDEVVDVHTPDIDAQTVIPVFPCLDDLRPTETGPPHSPSPKFSNPPKLATRTSTPHAQTWISSCIDNPTPHPDRPKINLSSLRRLSPKKVSSEIDATRTTSGQRPTQIDLSQTPPPQDEERVNIIKPDDEFVFPGAYPVYELDKSSPSLFFKLSPKLISFCRFFVELVTGW
jgi:hypothetical protein